MRTENRIKELKEIEEIKFNSEPSQIKLHKRSESQKVIKKDISPLKASYTLLKNTLLAPSKHKSTYSLNQKDLIPNQTISHTRAQSKLPVISSPCPAKRSTVTRAKKKREKVRLRTGPPPNFLRLHRKLKLSHEKLTVSDEFFSPTKSDT